MISHAESQSTQRKTLLPSSLRPPRLCASPRFAPADPLEARLAKARGQVDKLTPSLLARAFAGQLVPQDPTDEPNTGSSSRSRSGTSAA
jgi:hypothetical protein